MYPVLPRLLHKGIGVLYAVVFREDVLDVPVG